MTTNYYWQCCISFGKEYQSILELLYHDNNKLIFGHHICTIILCQKYQHVVVGFQFVFFTNITVCCSISTALDACEKVCEATWMCIWSWMSSSLLGNGVQEWIVLACITILFQVLCVCTAKQILFSLFFPESFIVAIIEYKIFVPSQMCVCHVTVLLPLQI